MSRSCLEKQKWVEKLFSGCTTQEDKYLKIIEIGRGAPKLDEIYKVPENVVQGCQSVVYLKSSLEDGVMMYQAASDALISSGLAILLTSVYSGELPETVLKVPPDFLERLQISTSLTPSRANGLYSIHLRMKQEALKAITSSGL